MSRPSNKRTERDKCRGEREESRIEEAESVGRLEKDSRGGREAVTLGAKEDGESEWRLWRTVTVWVGGEGGGGEQEG